MSRMSLKPVDWRLNHQSMVKRSTSVLAKVDPFYRLQLDLAAVMNRSDIEPQLIQKYRTGDIRHCFADIEKSKRLLGFFPRADFKQELQQLATYLADQIADDHVEKATEELARRGLVA